MKNHTLLKTNLIISIIILVGFFITVYTNYNTFRKILEDDIENMSKLTCSTIDALYASKRNGKNQVTIYSYPIT